MKKFLDSSFYRHESRILPSYLTPSRIDPRNYDIDAFHDNYLIEIATSEYGKTIYNFFTSENDKSVLKGYAEKHGPFLEKFYQRDLYVNVCRKIIEEKIDLRKLYPLYCTKYNFGPYEKVEKHLPRNLALDFFRASMYYNNDEYIYNSVKEWFINHLNDKVCEICGTQFKPAFFKDWVYFGASGHFNVCLECPVKTNTNKDEILMKIPKFVENCGFIPNSDFNPINNRFSSKVSPTKWVQSVKSIFEIIDWKQHFDSWFKVLAQAGVLKDNQLVTKRGVRCISISGNECNSLDELYIDNWLFEQGHKAIKEPKYPKHDLYNPSGKRRADWLVNENYIEYFGLYGDVAYDKKISEKMSLAKDLDIKLIAIFPKDINDLPNILKALNQ
jgi:hypothetical protein